MSMDVKPEEVKTPIIRYRKGTLLRIPFELIRDLKAEIGMARLDAAKRRERVKLIADGAGWGIAVESTWAQLLSELVYEFERAAAHRTDESWREVLAAHVEHSCQDGEAKTMWPKLREFIHENIDLLSGWKWSHKRTFAGSMEVYRRDGKYLVKTDEGEAEITGAKTAIEERLDYIADSILSEGGLLYYCLKVLALINTERFCRANPDALPKSVRIVLGEGDGGTFFLGWRWDLRWPYTLLPSGWRPDDNYCDPRWLGNDLLAYIAEKEAAHASTEVAPPEPTLVARWAKEFQGTTRQISFALETRLNIGKESESWVEFRGRVYRWKNRTLSEYPILISTYAAGETDQDVTLRSFKFMSHLTFQSEEGIESDFWVGSMSHFNPSVSNPFRPGSFGFPEGAFREMKGKDQERLDFALSLYREGVSSNSAFYRMLNFYKVIQLAFVGKEVKDLVDWIDTNAPKVRAGTGKRFQGDVAKSGKKISGYLYEANRNAIAHVNLGGGKAVLDPDSLEDLHRVNSALPLVRELAREAIRQGLF